MWACEVESGQCEYWGEKKNQPTSESTIITLLRGCKESALHYSPNGNQLDGPVILPRPNALHNIHFVFHIVQFNNFRFFANHSSFFGGLGLIYDTFLWSRLLEACSEIGIATNCALERRCKTDSVRRGHEGVREEEWHLTTMVWETWKKKKSAWGMAMPCARTSPPMAGALLLGTWIGLFAPHSIGVLCISMES